MFKMQIRSVQALPDKAMRRAYHCIAALKDYAMISHAGISINIDKENHPAFQHQLFRPLIATTDLPVNLSRAQKKSTTHTAN